MGRHVQTCCVGGCSAPAVAVQGDHCALHNTRPQALALHPEALEKLYAAERRIDELRALLGDLLDQRGGCFCSMDGSWHTPSCPWGRAEAVVQPSG
jgi:predicted AAA+ superfamily ATPase